MMSSRHVGWEAFWDYSQNKNRVFIFLSTLDWRKQMPDDKICDETGHREKAMKSNYVYSKANNSEF